ncbi:hypothetical protein HPA02_27080 [Bisbaumannia pacifica]|uniref:Uncharacterized protein n=1 Tax=Bisbaumannia pacifica TaxID=77098 RepID=A0A510XD20_9GAMM|nr:hypothetical protein [Halomonas pacifica]GEK48425.1 hypothetical protein HPA02_27080 [Halomonas pacifica]
MAGLLASALAGAMMGGGRAMQQNAQSRIQQRRDEALRRLDHDLSMARQNDQQQFTAGQNQQDRDFRAEQGGLDRSQQRELAEMRERGANRRTSMQIGARREEGRNDWQMVRTGDGMVQYSPSRNEYRPANLPEGAQMGGGELSERDRYRLDGIAGQIETIRERASDEMRELTTEEKAEMGRLQGQYDALLGGGGSLTPLERLLAGEGGAQPGGEQGQAPRGGSQNGGQPTVRGLLSQEMEERRNTQEANEARRAATQASERADAVIDRIEREMAGGASPGGMMADINRARGQGGSVSDETMTEAQQVAEELLSLDQNPNLSADRKRWIAERLLRLQDAGVPLNLEQ